MNVLMGRRSFLRACCALLALGATGCAREKSTTDAADQAAEVEERHEDATNQAPEADGQHEDDTKKQEDPSMKISVTVNGAPFVATVEDSEAGQALMARLPFTLQMEELHGNEKYCYTGEAFGGEQYAPATIEAGDLMVFGSDCLVLFYETFSNGGWSYARVGKIDDTTGLAEACGTGAATVEFASL